MPTQPLVLWSESASSALSWMTIQSRIPIFPNYGHLRLAGRLPFVKAYVSTCLRVRPAGQQETSSAQGLGPADRKCEARRPGAVWPRAPRCLWMDGETYLWGLRVRAALCFFGQPVTEMVVDWFSVRPFCPVKAVGILSL